MSEVPAIPEAEVESAVIELPSFPPLTPEGAKDADDAIGFLQELKQSKGRWYGKPLELLPYQTVNLRELFGRRDPSTGLRQYRTAFFFTPKKAGKSTLAAGLVCKLAFADQELGAEVYGAAYDKDQAKIVFKIAQAMVEQHEGLRELAKIKASQSLIEIPSTRSHYAALAHDTEGSHGFNIHGLVIDEFHTWKDAGLYQTLQKGTASRDQPLTIVITTAGIFDPESPCWKMYDYACKVRDGIIEDPTFLPVIFETPKDEHGEELLEWDDPEAWAIAQPGLGTTVLEAFYEEQARTAANMPSEVLSFKQLLLNQWPEQLKGWLDMRKWKECGELDYREEDFYGMDAWLGLDLASTKDLTAATLVIPLGDETVAVVCRVFCPADTIKRRSSEDNVGYDRWANEGWLTKTPGNATDYGFVREEIGQLAEKFVIREINPDPWNALQLSTELHTDGFRVVKIPQTIAHISHPAKELERLVATTRLRHGNNPILTWCASNATVRMDASGNIKPDKGRSKEKIDPITALVNGLARALVGQVKRPPWLISAG
jgi:phage terminase large subunit-like protein